MMKKKVTSKNPYKIENKELYRAMLELRRSNAATAIPAGQHKKPRSFKKKQAINNSLKEM